MEIKAVKFRKDGFYTQPFVMGGEDGAEKYDKNIRYRGSLQNYLIDTGDEVILVDTGIPAGRPKRFPMKIHRCIPVRIFAAIWWLLRLSAISPNRSLRFC